MMKAVMYKMALEWGCDEIEVVGRLGWEKFLPEMRKQAIILSISVERMGSH